MNERRGSVCVLSPWAAQVVHEAPPGERLTVRARRQSQPCEGSQQGAPLSCGRNSHPPKVGRVTCRTWHGFSRKKKARANQHLLTRSRTTSSTNLVVSAKLEKLVQEVAQRPTKPHHVLALRVNARDPRVARTGSDGQLGTGPTQV